MQAMQSVPVRYGPTSELTRANEVVHRGFLEDLDEDESLPKDPRQWSRTHVAQWVSRMAAEHCLSEAQTSKFMMNGKALCLMSLNMFLARVPVGGKLLYKDFQLRLRAAMYSEK